MWVSVINGRIFLKKALFIKEILQLLYIFVLWKTVSFINNDIVWKKKTDSANYRSSILKSYMNGKIVLINSTIVFKACNNEVMVSTFSLRDFFGFFVLAMVKKELNKGLDYSSPFCLT